MPDYQLERLDSRSFEQLVQALGIRILGNETRIFGDGPDGGREATFQGKIQYPSAAPWAGDGILQAKFCQKPSDEPKKNADWLIAQLKAEFAKFVPRPSGIATLLHGHIHSERSPRPKPRVCPEFYILVSNVNLSSVWEQGGKDRLSKVFDEFKISHGLKDYALWDYDQIRTFLDVNLDIRTTFGAWIQPGDVLMEMMKLLKIQDTDFSATMHRYLCSDLLQDQYAQLSQGGYSEAKTIPLAAVFVDLPLVKGGTQLPPDQFQAVTDEELYHELSEEASTRPLSNPAHFLTTLIGQSNLVLKPSVLQRGRTLLSSVGTNAGRFVLIGGPGQGKTTVGQYACQLFRAEFLKTAGPLSPDVAEALGRIQEVSSDLPQIGARRYPLRVDLKHLATALAEDRVSSLLEYLTLMIERRTTTKVSVTEFRKWLGGYPWILVLDGLDEVPASSNRSQLMRVIQDFISVEAHHLDADLLVLATTRPQGYSEEFSPFSYQHLHLAPLSPDQALDYGSRLANARHPGQAEHVERLTSSLKKATLNPSTARLMESPLQVTIMLSLIEGGGEPPEQRWKLFHDYYEVIYRREKERNTSLAEILKRYEPDVHWIHRRIGWLLQCKNSEPGQTDTKLTHAQFDEIVDARLLAKGHDNPVDRAALVSAMRQAATDRLVFLVGNTEHEIGFEVRSLQEFMAAEHCFDGGEACVRNSLHAMAPHGYWRNTFLFVAGKIYFERPELTDSIIAVCDTLNEEQGALQASRAGSRLALALLKDGAAGNQPNFVRVLARCGARAMDVFDYEVIEAFTDVGKIEALSIWRDEMELRLEKSGAGLPHHTWLLCLRWVHLGVPWALEFLRRFFPWRDKSAGEFLMEEDGRRHYLPNKFWEEFRPHVFFHPFEVLLDHVSDPEGKIPWVEKGFFAKLAQYATSLGDLEAERWPLQISDDFTFSLRTVRSLTFWANLEYPPEMNSSSDPGWLLCKSISAFANRPTLSSLVLQLESIAARDLPYYFAPNLYPWQFLVCIKAKMGGMVWDEIIATVRGGSLGNEADWQRWEEENREGIPLSRFRMSHPLRISNDDQGALLKHAKWRSSGDADSSASLISPVTAALESWADISGMRPLLSLCNNAVLPNMFEGFEPRISEEMLRRYVGALSKRAIQFSTQLVLALLNTFKSVKAQEELLAVVGGGEIRQVQFFEEQNWLSELHSALVVVLLNVSHSAQWKQILRAISYLGAVDASDNLDLNILKRLRTVGGDFTKAAIVFEQQSLRWEEAMAPVTVRETLSVRGAYPLHLKCLFDRIEKADHAAHLEAYLMEFMKLPASDVGAAMLQRASSLLVKIVARRPVASALPDPSAPRK